MNYYNGLEQTYSAEQSIFSGIIAIYMIVLVLMFIFYVISYVFKGIGMYTMAKRQGMDYPWLAFIPFARAYLQGELAGSIQLKSKNIKNPGIWLLALPFIGGAMNFIFYILFWLVGFASVFAGGFLSSSYEKSSSAGVAAIWGILIVGMIWVAVMVVYGGIYKVFGVLVNHQILERFTTKNVSIAHAVLGKLVPLYESICFFAMRNKEFQPGMEPEVPEMPGMNTMNGIAGTSGMDGNNGMYGMYAGSGTQRMPEITTEAGDCGVEEVQKADQEETAPVETPEETPVVIIPPAPVMEAVAAEEAVSEEVKTDSETKSINE